MAGQHTPLLNRPLINAHHCTKELESIFLLALERVAANDRAETASIANGTGFVEELLIGSVGTTGENHDTAAIERTLNYMMDTFCQGRDGDLILLVDFLGLGQFDLLAG